MSTWIDDLREYIDLVKLTPNELINVNFTINNNEPTYEIIHRDCDRSITVIFTNKASVWVSGYLKPGIIKTSTNNIKCSRQMFTKENFKNIIESCTFPDDIPYELATILLNYDSAEYKQGLLQNQWDYDGHVKSI